MYRVEMHGRASLLLCPFVNAEEFFKNLTGCDTIKFMNARRYVAKIFSSSRFPLTAGSVGGILALS
ncbi:MAG: hypothetical protein KatS3mg050_1611 [Litorilinea sp.]|nr:MAG: hypothetical protein KatS3mg050_1611 [Litorilinea sp.]